MQWNVAFLIYLVQDCQQRGMRLYTSAVLSLTSISPSPSISGFLSHFLLLRICLFVYLRVLSRALPQYHLFHQNQFGLLYLCFCFVGELVCLLVCLSSISPSPSISGKLLKGNFIVSNGRRRTTIIFVIMVKKIKIVQNCQNCRKLSDIVKVFQKFPLVENCRKL